IACRQQPDAPCAISWIGQPPLPPVKAELYAIHIHDRQGALEKSTDGTTLSLRRGSITHHWTTGLAHPGAATSHEQTAAIFQRYADLLGRRGLTLADHVVRTWLFVQNIDLDYQGLVVARREF